MFIALLTYLMIKYLMSLSCIFQDKSIEHESAGMATMLTRIRSKKDMMSDKVKERINHSW